MTYFKVGRPTGTERVTPPGYRWCARCEQFKLLSEFSKSDSYCRACRREYMREYRARTKGRKPVEIVETRMVFLCPECGTELVVEETSNNEPLWCPFDNTEFRVSLKANVYTVPTPEK